MESDVKDEALTVLHENARALRNGDFETVAVMIAQSLAGLVIAERERNAGEIDRLRNALADLGSRANSHLTQSHCREQSNG